MLTSLTIVRCRLRAVARAFTLLVFCFFFFFNDTATTEIYTLPTRRSSDLTFQYARATRETFQAILSKKGQVGHVLRMRSEEHTSELQSRVDLVCRLLL